MAKRTITSIRIDLGKAIRKERERQGMSRYMLAKLADIGETQLNKIEEGEQNANIDTISSILVVLNLEVTL